MSAEPMLDARRTLLFARRKLKAHSSRKPVEMNSYISKARAAGLDEASEEFVWKVRVRYAETDQMGRAYHGAFIPWLEVARVEWLRARGVTYAHLEEQGWLLPVTALNLRYHKPVPYDAEVLIRVRAQFEGVRLQFHYTLEVEGGCVATAEVELVSVDAATGRPKRWAF